MSVFDSFFDDVGFPALADIFGDAGTYQSVAGGDSVSCYVVITHDVVIQPTSYDATTVVTGTVVEVLTTEATLAAGDTITVGTTAYTCKKELENNGTVSKWVVHG